VFIPIARDELAAIDGSVQLTDRAAYHVTPELLVALDYRIGQEEDAEYAALVIASVAALTRFGERLVLVAEVDDDRIEVGDLVIDVTAYTARLRGVILDLTYKEFELLKFLAANRGRVLTRDALLHEVWGEDYIGGSRTVDVHIRRLRAKLGTEHDNLIGTVRNVGYRLDAPEDA